MDFNKTYEETMWLDCHVPLHSQLPLHPNP